MNATLATQGEPTADAETDLLRSSLDLLILKALSWGPRHGYAIAEWVERATEATILIEEGSLYPALHRLEEQGVIESEWGVSENNRRAKFYRLTAAGRRQLDAEIGEWKRIVVAISLALQAT